MSSVYALVGTQTVDFFRNIHANKLFLGVDAVDLKAGITNRKLMDIGVKNSMIGASEQIIAVCDHSKVGKRVFAKLCDTDQLDIFITDWLEPDEQKQLEEAGVKPIVTDNNEGV